MAGKSIPNLVNGLPKVVYARTDVGVMSFLGQGSVGRSVTMCTGLLIGSGTALAMRP